MLGCPFVDNSIVVVSVTSLMERSQLAPSVRIRLATGWREPDDSCETLEGSRADSIDMMGVESPSGITGSRDHAVSLRGRS